MTLLRKECKKVALSIPYILLVITLAAFAYVQEIFPVFKEPIEKPVPGLKDYGSQSKEIPEIIMPAAITSLYNEFCSNSYIAYPVGFYKNVTLSEKKQEKIADILSNLTGVPAKKLLGNTYKKTSVSTPADDSPSGENDSSENKTIVIGDNKNIKINGDGSVSYTITDEGKSDSSSKNTTKSSDQSIGSTSEASDKQSNKISVSPKEGLTYESFLTYMKKADKILGGGSFYSKTYLVHQFGKVPITYEEALDDYNLTKENDGITGAYARLFSDYIGMMLGLLPVFVAVAICLKDRRAKLNELVYTRNASSLNIILSRYAAILIMIMIPTLMIGFISNSSIWGYYTGERLDYLASFKYCAGWLLPTVMTSTAVGMFLTTFTDTPIAIAVQLFWWFIDTNNGISRIQGGFGAFDLMPRHNTLKYSKVFSDNLNVLIQNRLFYVSLSVLLIILTVILYEKKRRGSFHGYERIKALLPYFKKQS